MASEQVFVSMIGTQVLGVLQPLMVLAKNSGPLDIRLLHTAYTRPEAERVKDFCVERGLGEVTFFEVSQNLDAEDSAPRKVRQIAESLAASGQRPCFNMDGGMNYMLAACALALAPFRPWLILTTRERALIYDTADESCMVRRLPEPLSVEEILALQKVEYTAGLKKNPDACEQKPLARLITEEGIKLPASSLTNVEISHIVFDLVWNPGNNRLSFFKDWRFKIPDSNERLARERDFAHWSTDRKRSGQIYDKRACALVWDEKSKQRLVEDSGGQIEVLDLNSRYTDNGQEISAAQKLTKIFTARTPKVREQRLEKPERSDLPPMGDDTLVVCVGTNIIPTLVAISSHKPKHLVLCYNMQEKRVQDYARRIDEYQKELGLESVTLAKYPLEGIFPEQYLPEAEAGAKNIVVNITPGTKGQTCMLSLWAACHGYGVWSLNNGKRVCSRISLSGDEERIPMEICDPLLVFKIMGKSVLENSKTDADLAPDFPWLDALLEFMRRLARAGENFRDVWRKQGFSLGKDRLRYLGDCRWRLTLDGKQYDFEKENQGVWYEKLCARALQNAGAAKVRLNLGIRWDSATEEDLLEKYEVAKHLLELDVVGACQGDLVLISCKAKELHEDMREKKEPLDKDSLDYVAGEAHNTAAALGRFALSMVSDLGASKSMRENRVTILGWRDICEPEKLREHIAALRRRAGTTAGDA